MKILVYGATKGRGDGIGQFVARRFAEQAHHVMGLCRSADKAAAETQFPLEDVDIHAEAGRTRIKDLICEFSPDIIWSCCGTGFATPLWTMPEHEIEEMIEANVRNNILFCQVCAPSCVDGGAHLILTGSIAAVSEGAGAAVYSGVKGFLIPFVRAQRAEYARQGHTAKISLLLLAAVRATGMDLVAEAVEFIGRQSRAMELTVR